jgi:hypothetical protein
VADTFVQKGQIHSQGALRRSREASGCFAASPIRSERKKSEIAPLFVPRENARYLVITCPKCLRPNRLEAMNLNGGLHETPCQSCGTPARFEINHDADSLLYSDRIGTFSRNQHLQQSGCVTNAERD